MNVSIANSKAVENLTSGDIEHWMTTYHSVLATLKLQELKIPSTMHSGTFEFDAQAYTRSTPDSSGALWEIQIEAGVRALDLRICQIGAGQWVFHYNNQPSANTVQSLIDWCNAYYSASDSTAINEILVLNIRDCYSLSGAFDYVQLKNLFVNGLQSTGLIPRKAALLTLGKIHHDYWGKNIILSWDECAEDDLIWPCRWQGWINTTVPAGVNQKTTMQVYVIHNADTECSSTLYVANASPPALRNGQPGGSSELDRGLIEKCINYNLDAAPFYAPEREQSGYNYFSEKFHLIINPALRTVQYQVDFLGRGFMAYQHTPSNGYHNVEIPVARDQIFNLTVRALDVRGKISESKMISVNTTAPAPVIAFSDPSPSGNPKIKSISIEGGGSALVAFIMLDINSSYDFPQVEITVFRLQKEGIDNSPAVHQKLVPNSAAGAMFRMIKGEAYVAVVQGADFGGYRYGTVWERFGSWS
ncbi:hypothetical protein [Pseudomonas helleri]|uniref:hypothetical protein n=1 Tax=Pseudomonas helleri TaxID=1608996 RepID=UPI0028E2028B|nr:hypothetical protein [Pseudomonas helleri]